MALVYKESKFLDCTLSEKGAAGEPLPPPALLTKKEMKQHMEILTSQLEQVTRETKELRDYLISISEGSNDNRSEKLQHELEKISGHDESLLKTEMLQQGH
ncbi:hypothetical protein I79_021719 [Cricetulus griseus]|uniref:Disks large homolog 5 N-terminal domain-containing protein n=1 Tax=Cricetulus griseus TaxID=10029 RepID=G3IDE1_CRIGR|nr:hypothetical protein I79_021719 [Cricetulus griseus]